MAGGILIIDKPAGLTSHDVVARVRRITGERRVGHTGTLDPFATGVLVVLAGRATRLAQFLAGADKEYEALIRFGYATKTGDLTGARLGPTENAEQQTTALPSMNWTDQEIEAALAPLRGEIEQLPPMYSAKKIRGQKLYELARQGIEVEREAVRVQVHELETVRRDGSNVLLHRNEDGTCDLRVRVVCSAGTYVRALAESIGERLGVGAYLAALRRTRAGSFGLKEAVTLEELSELAEARSLDKVLLSPTTALSGMASVHLTSAEAERARHGMALRAESAECAAAYANDQPVFMIDADGGLIGVAIYEAETSCLRPRVVIAP